MQAIYLRKISQVIDMCFQFIMFLNEPLQPKTLTWLIKLQKK
jgi:hypothetical protein